MTTITILSDSHGGAIPQNVLDVANESDLVFFLGDGISKILGCVPSDKLKAVVGNCDFFSCGFKKEEVVEVDGVKMLLTHGDAYKVKSTLLPLKLRAKELGCSAVFYGHTHTARIDEEEGITFVCPGSIVRPYIGEAGYAYAVVAAGKLTVKLVPIR